jgi:hypothetical protein
MVSTVTAATSPWRDLGVRFQNRDDSFTHLIVREVAVSGGRKAVAEQSRAKITVNFIFSACTNWGAHIPTPSPQLKRRVDNVTSP